MKTYKEFVAEANKPTVDVYKVDLKGKLYNKESLNFDELDAYMNKIYGRWSNIRVVSSTGKTVNYTDNGKKWEKV